LQLGEIGVGTREKGGVILGENTLVKSLLIRRKGCYLLEGGKGFMDLRPNDLKKRVTTSGNGNPILRYEMGGGRKKRTKDLCLTSGGETDAETFLLRKKKGRVGGGQVVFTMSQSISREKGGDFVDPVLMGRGGAEIVLACLVGFWLGGGREKKGKKKKERRDAP